MLIKTSESQELSFVYLSREMTGIIRDKNVTGIMVAPELEDYKRNIKVTQMISNVVANNELVSNAFLYIPYNNKVVTSKNKIVDKNRFYDEKLIDFYLKNSSKMKKITVDGLDIKVKTYQGRILLFQDYPSSAPLGTLVFNLDLPKFYKTILGVGENSKENIFVYDENGRPIFTRFLKYPSDEVLNKSNNLFYSYQSSNINWKFIILPDNNISLNSNGALTLIIAVVLLLLIISVILSSYIIYCIFIPINDLINSIKTFDENGDLQAKRKPAKNEFDFFKLAYHNTVDKNKQLIELMESVAPIVLQRLFNTLLIGRNIDRKYVKGTLESIGSSIDIKSYYIVLIIKQVYPKDTVLTKKEMKFYSMSVSKEIHSLLDDKTFCYPLEGENDSIIYILNFDYSNTLMDIKSILLTFYKDLNDRLNHLPSKIIVGRGKVHDCILDIHHSYIEAQKDLSYRTYCAKKQPDMGMNNNLNVSSELLNILYYQENMSKILQTIVDGECIDSTKHFSLVREVSRSIQEIHAARKIYEIILETILEQIIMLQIDEEEISVLEQKDFNKDLKCLMSIYQMEEYTLNFFEKAIEIINNHINTSKYKYIERAKEYIHSNYSNGSLSLNEVSEYIGINSNYLSHIFSDNVKQGFVDYVNLFRIEKAKKLLDESEDSITDVGYKTGFNSSQNFIRVFKKYTGVTPGQYKKKVGELVT